MGLRVKDVERIVVNVPFTERCEKWNAREVWQWRVSEVIRVTGDSPGMVGYGETIIHYTWGRVTDEAIEKVKGKLVMESLGDDSLGAGLQMALYDLAGKAMEVPMYRLFNLPKVRDWCPISWWNIDIPPEENAAESLDAMKAGYTSYKFKARPWWDVYAQVAEVSKVTPRHFKLDLDWNDMLLNASNATPVLQALDKEERVAIYEGPIKQRDAEGYKLLRSKVQKPIAIHFGQPPFPTCVKEEMCDGFVVGGGIASVCNQGALSAAFEKPFWLQLVGTGLTTTVSAHLGAVLPFAQWPSVNCLNNYADDLLVKPLLIQGGCVRVPELPGLGVEIDEEALVKYKMEEPHSIPRPKFILTVKYEGGRQVHFADMKQCWDHHAIGNFPVQEPGVRMLQIVDDGTKAWADLNALAEIAPVWDVY